MKNLFKSFFFLFVIFLSCKEEKTTPTPSIPELATLRTDSVSNVSFTSAKVFSAILSEGKSAVVSAGIAWGLNPDPTVFDNKVPTTGFGVGKFSLEITGLSEGTTYYVRTYATNASGTAYSEQRSFLTRFL